jgi:hypothetical protein
MIAAVQKDIRSVQSHWEAPQFEMGVGAYSSPYGAVKSGAELSAGADRLPLSERVAREGPYPLHGTGLVSNQSSGPSISYGPGSKCTGNACLVVTCPVPCPVFLRAYSHSPVF